MGKFKNVMKAGLALVGGFGIGVMCKTGVNILTPEDANAIIKACCKTGGFILTSAVTRVAVNEINKIDSDLQNLKESVNEGMMEAADPETKQALETVNGYNKLKKKLVKNIKNNNWEEAKKTTDELQEFLRTHIDAEEIEEEDEDDAED